MSVIINPSFVVSPSKYVGVNSPTILWDDKVRDATASADEAASGKPVTLLQKPLTAPGERWAGTSTAEQHVEFDFGGDVTFSAVGIAAHTLGDTETTVKVQHSDDGNSWTDATSGVIPDDKNEAILFLFGEVTKRYVRLKLTPTSGPPEIGVVYVGPVLQVQHSIYQGHMPVTLGRNANRISQVSSNGHYLGTVVTSEWYSFTADLSHLDAAWYRANMEPFVRAALSRPFFWAWRPGQYSNEVGLAWLTSPAKPQNTGPGNLMSVALEMRAFVGPLGG